MGGTVVDDGWPGCRRLKDVKRDPPLVGDAPAHPVPHRACWVCANVERRALGIRHRLRPKRRRRTSDGFVFRFDRRRTPHAASDRLLGPSLALEPATCWPAGTKGDKP